MNYYNPYFSYPYMSAPSAASSGGLFSNLFKNGINWSSILSGTQKTLNIANQAIPLVKQITPVMKNAKTMFSIMNEFKKVDTPPSNQETTSSQTNNKITEAKENEEEITYRNINNNGPTFFI